MKIIDLLNKIANNEEVPKKIKIRGTIYKFTEIFTKNLTFADRGSNINNAYENDFENYWLDCARINEEVEIIEEDKKIEKWGEGALEEMEKCTDYTLEDLQKYIRILAETQNELIDEINNLKGND